MKRQPASSNQSPTDASHSSELRQDRYAQLLAESHRQAEIAICVAMVTSWIPGIEVRYLDDSEVPKRGAA